MYLEGTQISIKAKWLREYIGRKVTYLLFRDIDHDRGHKFRRGIITDIAGRNINFGDQDWQWMSDIKEIVLDSEASDDWNHSN